MTPYVIVALLTLLAALTVFVGRRFAHKSNRPRLFSIGAYTTAAGFMLLWICLGWIFSTDRGIWALPLFIAGVFVPVSFLGLGLQLMARACGAREEDHFDRFFSELVRRNP